LWRGDFGDALEKKLKKELTQRPRRFRRERGELGDDFGSTMG
jgi:hypothetical protein